MAHMGNFHFENLWKITNFGQHLISIAKALTILRQAMAYPTAANLLPLHTGVLNETWPPFRSTVIAGLYNGAIRKPVGK
jgi:hypothetical protein